MTCSPPPAPVRAQCAVADRSSRVPLWVQVALPLAVLAVALLIGSGVFDSSPTTPAQRAASIENDVRCPSCVDVSVAQSNQSTAIAVRHEIVRLVDQGQSTAEIDQILVGEYGQTILLVPPDAGGVPVIWLVPAAAGVVAIAGVGVVFWRRSRQFAALREVEG